MKTRFLVRPFVATSVVVALSLVGVSPVQAQPAKPNVGMSVVNSESPIEANKRLSQELAEGLEKVFTEVVYEQSPGNWVVDYVAAEREGISVEDAESLVKMMETSVPDTPHPIIGEQGLGSFGICVLGSFSHIKVPMADAVVIGRLLRAKQWRAAAEKIVQVAALNGATAALDYAITAMGGPAVFAARLALYAGSCALSEQL